MPSWQGVLDAKIVYVGLSKKEMAVRKSLSYLIL